jgi:ketosteroid isomerase-like protein
MKRSAYRYAFGAIVLAFTVACSGEVAVDVSTKTTPEATLEAAMQADRDFAAMAKAEGPKTAFLKYMHPTDSKFLQPGAVVQGAENIAGGFPSEPGAFSAEWAPDGGHGSASGDLAVTTGLYALSSGGSVIEKGRYVTVWTKDDNGELKATMDMSVPEPLTPLTPPAPDPEGRPG